MKSLVFSILCFVGMYATNAQVKVVQPSPYAKILQVIGLDSIQVEYSRPSMKGREIFGGLVPYNELWRTGANTATTITFYNEFNFGGTPVKKGTYGLYTIPNENEWEVILYQESDNWGTPKQFRDDLVVARCIALPKTVTPAVETFTINFYDLKDSSANLGLAWDDVYITVPITVDTNKIVLNSIESTMINNPTDRDYALASEFYIENNVDNKQALVWAIKANDSKPDSFSTLLTLSKAYAANGNYREAIARARESIALAEKAGYKAYIEENAKNIEEWKGK